MIKEILIFLDSFAHLLLHQRYQLFLVCMRLIEKKGKTASVTKTCCKGVREKNIFLMDMNCFQMAAIYTAGLIYQASPELLPLLKMTGAEWLGELAAAATLTPVLLGLSAAWKGRQKWKKGK